MSAVAELPAVPLGASMPGASSVWPRRLASLDRGQRMRLGLGIALLVIVVIGGLVMGRQAEWRVLFANLTDRDGGAIVAQLGTMNIPYKIAEGGSAIMVPADKVHETRLRLAAQGLPKGSVAGFELMDGGNRFGMTQFQERLSFQRGLEGELTRSIQSISSVQSARVHLALPSQNGFFREQQKPSASVLVTLSPGRALDRGQIAGIVHLIASSVPEMQPSAVSVVDESGKLLSNPPDGAGAGGAADGQQLQYVQQIEQAYTRRILDILEPVVGRQNVKAQVTADVDFSQTESTSEQHLPNQAAEAGAVRSQQVIESTGAGNSAESTGGIPGAVSNQPPGAASAPINGKAAPISAGASNSTTTGDHKREQITNYEVDKTVKVVRGATGTVRRLSAAVVVNYQPVPAGPGGKGKPTTKALTAQQIEQMTALVRESIGFNKDRGDSVNLMNTPFQVEATDSTELPLWKQPQMLDLARSMVWPVGTLLLVMLVLVGFIRPVLKAAGRGRAPAIASSTGRQLNAVLEEAPPRADLLPSQQELVALPTTPEQARLQGARQLAMSNPIAVANIVKNWVSGDVPA
jgi:flagellar M-ring protein FliF